MRQPERNRNERTMGKRDPLAVAPGAEAPSVIERLCQERGLRLTGQRQAIARVLSEMADSPDAEEVHRRAARLDPGVSLSTVYRALRLFEREGALKRWTASPPVVRGGSQDGRSRGRSRCDPVDGAPRHRLVDLETGAALVVQDAALDLLLAAIAARLGFRLLDQRLELFGIREDGPPETVPATTPVAVGEGPRGGPGHRPSIHGKPGYGRAGAPAPARSPHAHAGDAEPTRTHHPQGAD